MTPVEQLTKFAAMYQGLDIQYRRPGMGSDWPSPWRIRVMSCKHEDVRVTGWGNTLDAAIRAVLASLDPVE
jgi:hypothetical protein